MGKVKKEVVEGETEQQFNPGRQSFRNFVDQMYPRAL
jgi:hypothetical protein